MFLIHSSNPYIKWTLLTQVRPFLRNQIHPIVCLNESWHRPWQRATTVSYPDEVAWAPLWGPQLPPATLIMINSGKTLSSGSQKMY